MTHLPLPTEAGLHSVELGAGAAVEPPAGPHEVGVVAVVEHAGLPAYLVIIILTRPSSHVSSSLPRVHCSQS